MSIWDRISVDQVPTRLRDTTNFEFRVSLDVGTAGELASKLESLQRVISLGERWAVPMADEALRTAVWQAARSEPASFILIEDELLPGVFSRQDDYAAVAENWLHFSDLAIEASLPDYMLAVIPQPVLSIASANLPTLLGESVTIEYIEYENPLRVSLRGSGYHALGVIAALRAVASAGNKKQAVQGSLDDSRQRIARVKADLLEFARTEIVEGRQQVSMAELLKLIEAADLEAALDLIGGQPMVDLEGTGLGN